MDQCSHWHDIPSALQATSPNRPGHDLGLEINAHPSRRQCSPASGSMTSVPRPTAQTRQRHADRLPLVRACALFHKGKLLERPTDITPEANPPEPAQSTGTKVA